MEELLKKILAQDKTLLTRRDELIAILDEKVPGRLAREYNPIKKALTLNVGEIFATGNDNRAAATAKATEILLQSGLQEVRVKNVIDTFIKVLDWDKEPAEEIQPVKEIQPVEEINLAEEIQPAEETELPEWMEVSTNTPPAPSVSEIFQPKKIKPPITPPPPTPPAPQSSSKSTLIIGALIVVIIFLLLGRNNNSTPANPSNQSAEIQTPPKESYLDAKTDLSLNGVDLGTPLNQVVNVFGTPNSKKNENGRLRYYYDDIEVVFNGDYLSAFVTYSSRYKTARGLSVGSTYSEVINQYGSAPHVMNIDNLTLYEYDFNSTRGEKGLLRFAVNQSGTVEYISVRILEPEPPAPQQNKIPENVEQAARAFLLYHKNITDGNYRQAYDTLTYERQQYMGDYSTYAQGYANTISSEITALNLVSNDGDSVTFSYTLEARDIASGGRTLYQTFQGEIEMVKIGNSWKLNSGKSKRISESIK